MGNFGFLNMKELQQKLNLSRQTLTRYIKEGLPRIKKGKENFFNYDEVQQWITRNDIDKSYVKIMTDADNLFHDDPLEKLKYIRTQGNDLFYMFAMAELVQYIYSISKDRKIILSDGLIDYFFRGFMDVLRNLPKNLPASKYKYMASRIEDLVFELVRQSNKRKYMQKKVTFFDDKILYPNFVSSKNRREKQIYETFFSSRKGDLNNDRLQ